MNPNENLYLAESGKSVAEFIEDFTAIAEANAFVINNRNTMNMKETLRAHGGVVPDEFDLHMMQICKPTKADKSLASNPERAILMPKFVHVFSKGGKTQVRYLRYSSEDISALVADDPAFPVSLAQTSDKIHAMIEAAK